MQKLGMKPVTGVSRVTIKKSKNVGAGAARLHGDGVPMGNARILSHRGRSRAGPASSPEISGGGARAMGLAVR